MSLEASHHIVMPNDVLMAEVTSLLASGCQIKLRAKGRSMHPYIHDGKDVLVINPVDSDLTVGDVVLAKTDKGVYVVHRIISIDGDSVTLKGDGNLVGTEICSISDVQGKLTAIERGPKTIDCNARSQRLKALMLRSIYRPLRRIYNYLKHKI